MFKQIKKFFRILFCRHHSYMIIYIIDRVYDEKMDNDDLEDIPTFIKIKFCKKCGKIIYMKHDFSCNIRESSLEEKNIFSKKCLINYKQLTLYKS